VPVGGAHRPWTLGFCGHSRRMLKAATRWRSGVDSNCRSRLCERNRPRTRADFGRFSKKGKTRWRDGGAKWIRTLGPVRLPQNGRSVTNFPFSAREADNGQRQVGSSRERPAVRRLRTENGNSKKLAVFALNKVEPRARIHFAPPASRPKPRRQVSVTYGRGAAGCESTDRAGSKTRSVLRWL
jgi:hypothetical protein